MPLLNIPVEFFLFAITLLGVAVFHKRNLEVAVTGLLLITLYKGLVVQDVDLIPAMAKLFKRAVACSNKDERPVRRS